MRVDTGDADRMEAAPPHSSSVIIHLSHFFTIHADTDVGMILNIENPYFGGECGMIV
jgi:hypothetical protein